MLSMLIILSAGAGLFAAAENDYPSVDALPVLKELPDPFLRRDGGRLSSAAEWSAQRQALLAMVLHYEYGGMPPAPGDVTVENLVSRPALDGQAVSHEFTLAMGPEPRFRMHAGLLIPVSAGPKYPVIIAIDPVWQEHVIPTARQVIARGYAFAGILYHDVDPDTGSRGAGLYPHYPECDGGSLAAWAWACMRLTDYLCARPDIDTAHMAVTGHSRTGKAALLAGALDERIALTAPHSSGTGGAGSLRIEGKDCETLETITDPKRFHYWFHPRLRSFAGKESRLPFDQHFLKAAIAPRAFLSLEADDDHWSNPLGMQQTHRAALPVFEYLGASDRIALFVRPGGHDMIPDDWEALLDFADRLFFNKPTARTFNQWPYPDAPKPFSWSAPAQ